MKREELEKVLERIKELRKRAKGPFHPLHGEMHVNLDKLAEKEKKVRKMLDELNNDKTL